MDTTISRRVELSYLFPQQAPPFFNFRSNAVAHRAVALALDKCQKLKRGFRLRFLQLQIGQQYFYDLSRLVAACLPNIPTLVGWIFWLVFMPRTAKGVQEQTRHNLLSADKADFGDVIDRTMSVFLSNALSGALYRNVPVAIYATCEVGVKVFFFHVLQCSSAVNKQHGEWLPQLDNSDPYALANYVDKSAVPLIHPVSNDGFFTFPDGIVMNRVGKKRAGRLLEDREWDEFPTIPTHEATL